MARLAHPDGEAGIAAACSKFGAAQVISNNASMTPEQIVKDSKPGQVFGWQLYVQTERRRSEEMLARINKLEAVKFIVLTLDAPVPGKREDDERAKSIGAQLPVTSAVQASGNAHKSAGDKGDGDGGIGRALFAGTAPDLTWRTTLPWLVKHTHLPIVLKGLQTHEDAYIASLHAPTVKGIIVSNHGGRSMDTAPPPVHTLLEIRKYCPQVFEKLEVFVDGGIRRGTDVVKALCLGARGVGLGRAPLYALGVGGPKGVERMLESECCPKSASAVGLGLAQANAKTPVLKQETETCMRLLGVEKLDDLGMRQVRFIPFLLHVLYASKAMVLTIKRRSTLAPSKTKSTLGPQVWSKNAMPSSATHSSLSDSARGERSYDP